MKPKKQPIMDDELIEAEKAMKKRQREDEKLAPVVDVIKEQLKALDEELE